MKKKIKTAYEFRGCLEKLFIQANLLKITPLNDKMMIGYDTDGKFTIFGCYLEYKKKNNESN